MARTPLLSRLRASLVRSICTDDFTPAVDQLTQLIQQRVDGP